MTNIEEVYTTDSITGESISLHDILMEMERRIELLVEEFQSLSERVDFIESRVK